MNAVETKDAVSEAAPCPCCGTAGTEKRTIAVEIPDNLTANIVQADGSRQGVPLTLDPATTTWSGTGTVNGTDVEIRFSIPTYCGSRVCRCEIESKDEAFAAAARPASRDPFRAIFAVEIGAAKFRIEVA